MNLVSQLSHQHLIIFLNQSLRPLPSDISDIGTNRTKHSSLQQYSSKQSKLFIYLLIHKQTKCLIQCAKNTQKINFVEQLCFPPHASGCAKD